MSTDTNNKENGHKSIPDIPSGSLEDAFNSPEGFSSIKVLVEPGTINEFSGLLMRADFPEKQTSAHVKVIQFCTAFAKCDKYHYKIGKQKIANVVAGFTSVNGKRISLTVDAITGQRAREDDSKGIGEWLKKHAYGNKNDQSKQV
jgi:hypothetical protein